MTTEFEKELEEILNRCRANAIGANKIWSKEDTDYYLNLTKQLVQDTFLKVLPDKLPYADQSIWNKAYNQAIDDLKAKVYEELGIKEK